MRREKRRIWITGKIKKRGRGKKKKRGWHGGEKDKRQHKR